MIQLRSYQPSHALPLLHLFRKTIRRVNAYDYSEEQIEAWASDDIDEDSWAKRFDGRYTMVAAEGSQLLGFGELELNGHIDRFYVEATYLRLGIGSMLLAALVDEAIRQGMPRIWVEASITARPFFEANGFRLVGARVVQLRGLSFQNFHLERTVAADGR